MTSAIGVPVVTWRPSSSPKMPERMRTLSGSRRCVVKRDCPGLRLSRKRWMSEASSGMRGGQPSMTQPIAGPWLSPQVVTRNKCPKVLCDIACGFSRRGGSLPARWQECNAVAARSLASRTCEAANELGRPLTLQTNIVSFAQLREVNAHHNSLSVHLAASSLHLRCRARAGDNRVSCGAPTPIIEMGGTSNEHQQDPYRRLGLGDCHCLLAVAGAAGGHSVAGLEPWP